jgi:putative endonuclease
MLNRKEKGKLGEDLAVEFLKKQGFQVLAQNFRCPLGEIDLVAHDGKTLVFVEVKSRFVTGYGAPEELVSRTKQRRLTRLARWYLKQHRLENQPARFDVVAITWQDAGPKLKWIANAFEACD